MKDKIRLCPFCKGDASLVSSMERRIEGNREYKIVCPICGVSTPIYTKVEDCTKAWNTRYSNDEEVVEGETLTAKQMRFELVKDCISATLSRTHIPGGEIKSVVGYSIRIADEIINQLKQQSDE